MFELRRFDPDTHSQLIGPLTEILHAAYRPLAAAGMHYVASHQPPETTLRRLQSGESYLAFHDGELAGTITLYSPHTESECAYYLREGVYSFGQFAIRPDLHGRGYGSKMMDEIEATARTRGASELALDTSEHASDLIRMYEKRGYAFVAHTRWSSVNYRSVVMSRRL